MPFKLGTASVGEMAIYTLWNTYVKDETGKSIPLKINVNTLIDIEALSLPYSVFYENCIKESSNSIYTPYFIF